MVNMSCYRRGGDKGWGGFSFPPESVSKSTRDVRDAVGVREATRRGGSCG